MQLKSREAMIFEKHENTGPVIKVSAVFPLYRKAYY